MSDPPLSQPTSPTAPEFAVTAERLASLKSRLQAISVKHANRRQSQDSSAQNSPRMSISGESPSDQRASLQSLEKPEVISHDVESGSNDFLSMTSEADQLEEVKEPSETCQCRTVMNESDPTVCAACSGVLAPIAKLEKERARLSARLVEEKRKVRALEQRQDVSTHEMSILRTKVHDLEEAVSAKDAELASVNADLDRLGQKLIDEVEVRAELQHSKDAVQEELEELTRSLFEEANSMVATEARHRHEHQQRESTLRVQMGEMQVQLQMERDQLKELRLRMESMEGASHSNIGLVDPNRLSVYSSNSSVDDGSNNQAPPPEEAIDSVLFAEFEEFLTANPEMRLSKMHSLSFMKNALEDDVSPCLRFGGNPRTSTKRLIDAIFANTCFVEEISPAQLANLDARRTRQESTSRTGSPRLSVSPTRNDSTSNRRSGTPEPDHPTSSPTATVPTTSSKPAASNAIFNKTVMERLSNAFSSGSLALSSSHNSLSSIANSCSACGRTSSSPVPHQLPAIRFQFRTSDTPEDTWNPICLQCRDRLVAVCEFYNFARHVRQGLYSTRRPQDLYLEVLTLKRRMFYARIGAGKFAEGDKSFVKRKPRPNSSLLSPASSSVPALATPNDSTFSLANKMGTSSGLKPPKAPSISSVDSAGMKSPTSAGMSVETIDDQNVQSTGQDVLTNSDDSHPVSSSAESREAESRDA